MTGHRIMTSLANWHVTPLSIGGKLLYDTSYQSCAGQTQPLDPRPNKLGSLAQACYQCGMDRRTVLIGAATGTVGTIFAGKSLYSGAMISPLPPSEAAMVGPGKESNGFTLMPVPLGAGGFVTGIDISKDGKRLVCRTDVMGAYVRDLGDPQWRPLFGPDNIPQSDYDPLPRLGNGPGQAENLGCAGIRIAPSDKNIIYSMYLGYVYRSSDGGKTAKRTSLAPKRQSANGVSRSSLSPIDIHPADPNKVIVGTYGEGVYYTVDGGKKWKRVEGLPQSAKVDKAYYVDLVSFDPKSPNDVFIHIAGTGLFISNNGVEGPFELFPGAPLVISGMIWEQGTLYLCDHDNPKFAFYRKADGITTLDCRFPPKTIIVDPMDAQHLMLFEGGGYLMETFDHGKSWRPGIFRGRAQRNAIGVPGEVAWIEPVVQILGNMIHKPGTRDHYYMAGGYGVLKVVFGAADDIVANHSYWLEDWSHGIEAMIGTGGVSIPGNPAPILACWDTGLWKVRDMRRFTNLPSWPTVNGVKPDPSKIRLGRSVDYAIDDPNFLVATVGAGAVGFSRNAGEQWIAFEKQVGVQGIIAASNANQLVWLSSNNGPGGWSDDGGQSWNPISLDGAGPTKYFANAFYVDRYNLTSDKTRPGVFALVYTVMQSPENAEAARKDPAGNPLGGVWVTFDGGANWQQSFKGVIGYGARSNVPPPQDGRQFWRCKLQYIPGCRGELLYTGHDDDRECRLWWSKNDGLNWQAIEHGIRDVASFGFGKPAPGSQRPTVFLFGEMDGQQGLYFTNDWFATKPQLVTRWPTGMISGIGNLIGDVNIYGRCYIGSQGNGWWKVDLADRAHS